MLDILFCVRDEHDPRLVLLAALVCLLSALTAVFLLRQSRLARGNVVHNWAMLAGLNMGFGIWATHFIAMLGYDSGFVAGYHIGLTGFSLLLVLLTTTAAFRIADTASTIRHRMVIGGLLAGGGFALMHYTGMMALQIPAIMHWNMGHLVLSLLFSILPLYPALRIALNGHGRMTGFIATALIFFAVIGLHFSGMAAIRLTPSRMDDPGTLLSPQIMSIVISSASAGLMLLCMASWLIACRMRAAITASERQFSILVKGISDCAIYMLDRTGHVANWNAGAERLEGYLSAEAVGLPLSSFYVEEDRAAGLPKQALEIAGWTGKFTGEGWRLRKDGSRFWAHVSIERINDDAGDHIGFAKITRDMTRFKEDQDRIEQARAHLNAAMEHMHQGLCLFDADERLVLRNRRFAELWHLPANACQPGQTLSELARTLLSSRGGEDMAQDHIDIMRQRILHSLETDDLTPVVVEFGDSCVVSIASRILPEGGWVTTFEDITERRRSEAKIAHMAHHDGLTGLPNRVKFNHWLDVAIEAGARTGHQVALVAIDLDRFKEINDTQGHAAGDQVLQRIAQTVTGLLAEGEMLARLGGDEFAAAKTFAHPAELSAFVDRLAACFSRTAHENHGSAASLGVAIWPADGENRESLLNNADLAMYRAKASISDHVCYYEPGMDEGVRQRRLIANDLRHALGRNEMALLYQPQHSLKTDRVCGYEALLRWRHPLRGHVSPDDFIPIAEETGEIIPIGQWVLRTACEDAMNWPIDCKVAVNLSTVQLLQADLPEMVTNILLETGLPPRRLELEITETAIITDKARALHCLRRIKALGVSIAMDDFGTGYSSLDTLHSFPFDKIKIDKSFLLQSDESIQARAIIRAVMALGNSLDIPVLAEGVETRSQLDLLLAEGCNEAQGYYFGRPDISPSAVKQASSATILRA